MSRVIVVLNVLYDDVYMYKSLQIMFLFCSVLLISSHINHVLQWIHTLLIPR